ncbi:MAG: class I SAM-dependent methyltransferase [Candidatus Lokiarchaeota archaeon]|nr:class I SAM-dependent methyltransferase [Candidatus Lokiarchaeota archaeon]
MDLIYEIFDGLPRQGPGDPKSTQKAYSFLGELPLNLNIIDIGCGTGQQTIELAKLSRGNVIGLDNHQPYLNELKRKVTIQGLSDILKTINMSMFELDFEQNYFDIIWSEGAIYIYGLEKALEDWRIFLKNNGYFVFSHITWFKGDYPNDLKEYWKNEYPDIKTIEENIKIIEEKGFNLIKHFKLPKSSWWKYLYTPLEGNITRLKEKYKKEEDKLTQINEVIMEIELFRKYSDFYGYTFFIIQKI